MRFTADDAFDAADAGEPIVMEVQAARKLCRDHDASFEDWIQDCAEPERLYHADAILAWLGY